MCYAVERSVRIREVEGSNPFRSTKMKTVRKGGFHFAVGLRESKFIPPCGGNPFRSTKNKPPAGVALFLLCPANALPHCASCCALPCAVVYCT